MEAPVHGPDRDGPRPRGKHALDVVLCLVLFLLALAAYLRTMRPTFGWGDPSELITAAYHLGVGHSPGYPTWMLLAHPFSRLPIGDVAFRVNFFNALLGGLAIPLLYLVYHRIAGSRIAAFVAALAFAFTATFWDITTEADVFTLHVCFAAVILLIALRWRRRPHDRWLYLLSGSGPSGDGASSGGEGSRSARASSCSAFPSTPTCRCARPTTRLRTSTTPTA